MEGGKLPAGWDFERDLRAEPRYGGQSSLGRGHKVQGDGTGEARGRMGWRRGGSACVAGQWMSRAYKAVESQAVRGLVPRYRNVGFTP